MKSFLKYQLPIIAYAGLIVFVSSLSKIPSPDLGITFIDKIAHFLEYFLFLVLMYRALSNAPLHWTGFRGYLGAALLSVAYAGLDEFHQSFVPGRRADPLDFMFDTIGIIVAVFVVFRLNRRRESTSQVT